MLKELTTKIISENKEIKNRIELKNLIIAAAKEAKQNYSAKEVYAEITEQLGEPVKAAAKKPAKAENENTGINQHVAHSMFY